MRAAIVTGASSGIGEAFAHALAARSVDLLLSALPADEARLREIARELSSQHKIRAEVAACDLAEPDAATRLKCAADALGFEPDTLVNNAGFGVTGPFESVPFEQHLAMVRLNVEAVAALTALYLPGMAAKGNGNIINVASTAGLAPVPYFAIYAASKAFVLSLSQALWAEYRHRGVRIVAVCPGPVRTRFHERSLGQAVNSNLSTEQVAATAFEALERDRPVVVQRVRPFGTVFAFLSAPILPRRLRLLATERIARRFFKQR
jgi:short-subunit dehydrogenase